MKRMSSQPVFVEGLSLLGPCSRNGRVYSQQVMQEAVAIFLTTEEKTQKWKERHINEIKAAGEEYDC